MRLVLAVDDDGRGYYPAVVLVVYVAEIYRGELHPQIVKAHGVPQFTNNEHDPRRDGLAVQVGRGVRHRFHNNAQFITAAGGYYLAHEAVGGSFVWGDHQGVRFYERYPG